MLLLCYILVANEDECGESVDFKVNFNGLLNWAKSIPEIMMDGSVDTVAFQMKNLFGALEKEHRRNYKRVDVPTIDRNYSGDMADASKGNIDKLVVAGEQTIEAAKAGNAHELGLDDFIQALIDNN